MTTKHTPGPRAVGIDPTLLQMVEKKVAEGSAYELAGAITELRETIASLRLALASSERQAATWQQAADKAAQAAPELLAALRRLEKAQHPVPQGEAKRTGRSHLDLCDEWNAERNAACEAARALLARVDGGGK